MILSEKSFQNSSHLRHGAALWRHGAAYRELELPIVLNCAMRNTPVPWRSLSSNFPILARTPPLSSSSLAPVVTPSPPRAPMKQRKIYSTPMLHLMDKIIQEGELLLVEYRRNQNTAEARENERKRKIRILMSLR
ncbi:unnamed protein product [Trifolium pratense]|uniref:Uncharacterized protein n=1 Tax=Trifolium pratense TaxID=57577 RepID=A0ACB0JXD7_TRIPR|nr:unnamed protein product [Trifolium pratense]